MDDKKHRFGAEVERALENVYITQEFTDAQRTGNADADSFDAALDLLDLNGTGGEYEWHSDLSLPEYLSMHLTQSSIDAAQIAMTRDYADVYLEDGSEDAKKKAAAAKECINRTLNQRHLHYFQKYMRAQSIRRLSPKGVLLRCWWERRDIPVVTGFNRRFVPDETKDVHGNEMIDPSIQVAGLKEMQEPVIENEPVVDRFNCDVVDPANTFESPEYAYTMQEKRYVFIRFEKTLDELQKEADDYGYVNLDLLEKVEPPQKTDTVTASEDKEAGSTPPPVLVAGKPYDIVERYGGGWVKVTSRDEITKEPLEAEPGYDEQGKKLEGDDIEFQEIVVAWAKSGSQWTLIRYQLQAYVDVTGVPYRPLVRGLCYIHPRKDGGLSDEKIAKPLQAAINDNFNMGNDRVRLATFPVIAVNKYDAEDNDTVYDFKPGHRMQLTDVNNAKEFKIRDDINGALAMDNMLKGAIRRGLAVYPSTQGETPAIASTTATATVDAAQHANTRASYQSLTAEHTMLTELYWMILQMTAKFAHPKTGKKLMGEKVYDFDPNADYIYKPVTQSIESESSKYQKRKDFGTMFGYAAQIPHPSTVNILNWLFTKFAQTFGDEVEDIPTFDAKTPIQQPATAGGQVANAGPVASNQNAVPVSGTEAMARGM